MPEHAYEVDWPSGFERTPPDERENTSKFSANFRRSKRDLKKEMDRLGVDHWRLDDVTGSGGDPGVVVRWTKDGIDHAVACDAYTTKASNLRSVYLWINETRKRGQRPVETGQDEFATARLPPGDGEEAIVAQPAAEPEREPHEVLGVAEDAPDDVVEAVARRLKAKHHPDSGEEPDREEFIKVGKAKEAMLDESA